MDKTKIIDVYRDSDIFVMPSKFETFGLVYVEALTQGLHLIYTKGQGLMATLQTELLVIVYNITIQRK